MKEVTAVGQTVDAAVESALAQLKTTKNQVEIIVVEEGKKGFLGFGSRTAKVIVRKKVNPVETVEEFLKDVCEKMGVPVKIQIKQNGRNILYELSGEKIALLIGKRGQTLNSIQYLAQLVINRESKEYLKVLLDAEGYRERRKQALIQLAERIAYKAVKIGKEIPLEPMPADERKTIHTALVSFKGIKTYSSGEDAKRHIIIAPIKVKNR
ncbi:SpoIIIJ-associated RNA/ssDNA-binding protein [Niallia circulans]|uniref:RNA-binding protein KhpB n=1 Tax=Niallia circulans TaxID=1397 RepID=A0A0J1I2I4_NIACI|nr:RNA-binding cell elongation regulator Jag/EloR [Niallia circulans]KLV20103.1 protein jag [Niallia circulans]MDR4316611.1 protein jag [Niallia circulans]MED3840396.1 RNA-binding cell elongation regulator Jag/EloR [Niallia circulans]MED4242084.1 RNA-binding cell elongation regulator Jag/EloR [Niallia circulans]MED4249483.1 RNA-binding cell elongation regulator Jag/EloR [Niallia circulans]